LHQIVRTFGMEGDELKAAREELKDGWLTIFLRGLSDILARGGGEYFADNRLTVADLKVFVQVRSLRSGNLDHIPADFVETLAPNLAAHEKRIAVDPIVVDYYDHFKAAS
jgi:glutathione S-transferase